MPADRTGPQAIYAAYAAALVVVTVGWSGGCADTGSENNPPATYLSDDTAASSGGTSSGGTSSGGTSSGGTSSGGTSSGGTSSGATDPFAFPDGPPLEVVTNGSYYDRALLVINTAEKELDIVQFEAKASPGTLVANLVAAVENAHKRGVAVRVLLDDEIEYNTTLRKSLTAKGVPAKTDSKSLRTHCKIIRSEKAVLFGSTNWSQTSITKNNEANLLVRHKGARTTMKGYLDALWKNTSSHHSVDVSSSSQAAMYSDKTFGSIASKLIEKAEDHIEIISYSMNLDPKFKTGPVQDVVAAIQKRMSAKPKLTVRVILDASSWSEFNTELNTTALSELKKRGIIGRLDDPEKITHAKLLIVDNKVVVGTNNWGKGGFELYHEVGIRTSEENVQQELLKYFNGIWEKSK